MRSLHAFMYTLQGLISLHCEPHHLPVFFVHHKVLFQAGPHFSDGFPSTHLTSFYVKNNGIWDITQVRNS